MRAWRTARHHSARALLASVAEVWRSRLGSFDRVRLVEIESLRIWCADSGKVNFGNGVAAITPEARRNNSHVHFLKFFRKNRLELRRVYRTLKRIIRFPV